MRSDPFSRPVRRIARIFAEEYLAQNSYCPCATNRERLAVRFLPLLEMFEQEIEMDSPLFADAVCERMAIYIWRMYDELGRGLHMHGESAKPSSGPAASSSVADVN